MKIKSTIKLISIWVLLFLLFGEVMIRVYDAITSSNLHKGTSVQDEILGWKSKADYLEERNEVNGMVILYATTQYGFKAFGPSEPGKKNVFFIGDSFTQSVEVNNEDTFYEIISDSLDFSLFAYGMSGYGTFQQKLILEQYKNEIKPDLVVWQFCTNDFVDNHYELNRECNYKVNAIRPYQNSKGEVFSKNPYTRFEQFLLSSRFVGFIYNRVKKIRQNNQFSESGESKINRLGKDYEAYDTALAITSDLFSEIKKGLGPEVPLIVFCADGYEPQLSDIREICLNEGILFFDDHLNELAASASSAVIPFSIDGVHWNEIGHRIVATTMLDYLKEQLGSQ